MSCTIAATWDSDELPHGSKTLLFSSWLVTIGSGNESPYAHLGQSQKHDGCRQLVWLSHLRLAYRTVNGAKGATVSSQSLDNRRSFWGLL